MLKLKDGLIQIILYFVFTISFLIMLIGLRGDWRLLLIPFTTVFIFILILIKRRKKILKYVKDDFLAIGFELIDEKPMSWDNIEVNVGPNINVGRIPISRFGYIVRYERIFRARYENGKVYELYTECTQKWNLKNEVLIKDRMIFRE